MVKYNSNKAWVKYIPTGEVFCRSYQAILDKTAKSPQQFLAEKAQIVKEVYGDDFEMAEYVSSRKVIIRNIRTGETFSRTWKSVTNYKTNPKEKDKARQEKWECRNRIIRECFGDDYELASWDGEKAYVRHIPTGEVFTKRTDAIKNKTALSPMQLLERRRRIVEEAYDGSCELVEFISGERTVLKDLTTGVVRTVHWRTVTKRLERMGKKVQ